MIRTLLVSDPNHVARGRCGNSCAVELLTVIVSSAPQRTCIACRQKADRSALTRFVLRPDQQPAIVHDVSATLPGRGAWVHPDAACLSKALTPFVFARAFRTKIRASDLPTLEEDPEQSG